MLATANLELPDKISMYLALCVGVEASDVPNRQNIGNRGEFAGDWISRSSMSETKRSITGTKSITSSNAMMWTFAFLTLCAIAWTLFLHDKFAELSASDRSVGRELRVGVQLMNAALFRFQLSGDNRDRSEFQQTSRELTAKMTDAKRVMPGLVDDAVIAYEGFLSKSDEFLGDPVKSVRKDTASTLNETLASHAEPVLLAADQLRKREEGARREKLGRFKQFQVYAVVLDIVLVLATAFAAVRVWKTRPRVRTDQEERLVALGALAAGVAHEVRNPLTAIKFRLFSLGSTLGSSVSSHEDFQLIRREIDRLERIVQDFLNFAKPVEPNFSIVEASEMLRLTRNLLTPELDKRSIQVHIDAESPINFSADPEQIQQVLINLAQNAADSMQDGGSITLRARQGAASIRNRTEPVAIVEVADTGAGVPQEIERKLFDPFVTSKEGGLGLGLSIAARIIEKHGGLIQCATNPKHGTTFTVILPRERNGNGSSNSAH